MAFHPNFRLFGPLELLEVYEFYDAPLLVSCRTPTGALYLGVAVSGSENSEGWLYVSVSQERFTHIRSGLIDLHLAFSRPENGFTFLVDIPHNESADALVTPLTPDQLDDNILPSQGEFLSLPTETLPSLEAVELWTARTLRDAVGFRLELPEFMRSEAPAKLLGAFLSGVQDTVNSLAQSLRGSQSRRGTLAREILALNELAVVGAGGGSFSIVLAAMEPPTLFVNSLPSEASMALEAFVNLLSVSGHAEELQKRLADQPRVASNFLGMLRAINRRVTSVSVEWASPQPGRAGRTSLSAVEVDAAIAVIEYEASTERKDFWVLGRLVGANLDKKTFEVWSLERADHYAGRVAEEAVESMNGAVIGKTYRAWISQTAKLKPSTGDVQEETVLLQLEAVS